jgi:hypothetical protein
MPKPQQVLRYVWIGVPLCPNCGTSLQDIPGTSERWECPICQGVFGEGAFQRERIYIDAEVWWPLSPGVVDGHIVVADEYLECREPDLELLECGHEQPPRKQWGKGRQYYNRRRRCDECLMESGGPRL